MRLEQRTRLLPCHPHPPRCTRRPLRPAGEAELPQAKRDASGNPQDAPGEKNKITSVPPSPAALHASASAASGRGGIAAGQAGRERKPAGCAWRKEQDYFRATLTRRAARVGLCGQRERRNCRRPSGTRAETRRMRLEKRTRSRPCHPHPPRCTRRPLRPAGEAELPQAKRDASGNPQDAPYEQNKTTAVPPSPAALRASASAASGRGGTLNLGANQTHVSNRTD